MLDYAALRAVAAVAETGSFERAAQRLNVTPSAISQRVKHLEDSVGAALIVRGTPCCATEKGAWLCRHIEHVALLEQELFEQIPGLGGADAQGRRMTVQIATNADSLGSWFLPAAAAFSEQTGHLLNIAVDDQDYTIEWLKRGQVVAAVTSVAKPAPGCRSISLGSLRYRATASPAFVARHFPDGVTVDALAHAPALTFNQKDRLQAMWIKAAFGVEISIPTHWLPSTQSFVEASLLGLGWGMNPDILAAEHLATGRLIDLSPGLTLDTPLSWQMNRMVADHLQALTTSVTDAARRKLHQPDQIR